MSSVVQLNAWASLRATVERYRRSSALASLDLDGAAGALLAARTTGDFERARWWLLSFVAEELRRETAGARHALLHTPEGSPDPSAQRQHAQRATALAAFAHRLIHQPFPKGSARPAAPSTPDTDP